MSEYLLGIVGTVLLSALIIGISPKGKTAEIIKGTTKVVCLLAIVAPILQFFQFDGKWQDFFEKSVIQTDVAYIRYCSEKRIEYAQDALSKTLAEEFGGEFTVMLIWSYTDVQEGAYETERVKIDKVQVVSAVPLSDEVWLSIEAFIQSGYACETEMVYGE